MSNTGKKLAEVFGENRIKLDEVVSGKLSSKIGGNVKYYFEAQRQDELIKALTIAREGKDPFVIIGTGSNTIVADEGYYGLIIKNASRKFEILSMRGKITNNSLNVDKAYLYAESGCLLNQVVRYSIDQGYAGLEELLGTRGSVGGFLRRSFDTNENNSAINSLYQVRLIKKNGATTYIDQSKNAGSDKTKLLNDDDFILSATFLLTPGHERTLWEKGTKKAEAKEATFALGTPIGILFKDITLGKAMSAPTPGNITSAKELIQKAGAGGMKVGGAMNMNLDGNTLLNIGDATTTDILELMQQIKSRVFAKFNVKLEMELKILN